MMALKYNLKKHKPTAAGSDIIHTRYHERKQRMQVYSKHRYNTVDKQKKKFLSKQKYASDATHRERVKSYSKQKYDENEMHRERKKSVRNMIG